MYTILKIQGQIGKLTQFGLEMKRNEFRTSQFIQWRLRRINREGFL